MWDPDPEVKTERNKKTKLSQLPVRLIAKIDALIMGFLMAIEWLLVQAIYLVDWSRGKNCEN